MNNFSYLLKNKRKIKCPFSGTTAFTSPGFWTLWEGICMWILKDGRYGKKQTKQNMECNTFHTKTTAWEASDECACAWTNIMCTQESNRKVTSLKSFTGRYKIFITSSVFKLISTKGTEVKQGRYVMKFFLFWPLLNIHQLTLCYWITHKERVGDVRTNSISRKKK